MVKMRYWWMMGATLALWTALAVGFRIPFGTKGDSKKVLVPPPPFATSIVDRPFDKLPLQGPWTVSDGDLTYPTSFIVDLVEHIHPPFPFLWEALSTETRSALEKDCIEMKILGKRHTPELGWQT